MVTLSVMSCCKIWHGSRNTRGYGQFRFAGKKRSVHRFAYWWWYQQNPGYMYVCHKCDNPSCYEPTHLFLGTQSDNMADMASKGRSLSRPNDRNPNAKLSMSQAESVYAMATNSGLSLTEIGRLFGVTRYAVRKIRDGVTWLSLTRITVPPDPVAPVNLVSAKHI